MRQRILGSVAVLSLALLASCVYVANMPPVASFTATPAVGTTPLDVSLDATASSDPDGDLVAFVWSFGDGQTSSTSAFPFVHEFTVQSEARTFTIVLTVTDDGGAVDTAVQYVTVNP